MTSERVGDENEPTINPRRNPQRLAAAVTSAAKAHGWQRAAAIIERNWDAFANEAPQHLLTALKALPGEAFVETPGLLVAANYLQQVVVTGEPSRFFHDGRLAPQLRDDDSNELNTLILLTGQAASARTTGGLDEARTAAEQARDTLLAMPSAQRAPMAGSLPHLRFQWGRTLDVTDAPGALAEYEASYDLARLTGQPVIARRAAGHIAWHHAERGRLQRAELWLARANGEPATNSRYDAIVFLTSALLRYDRGEKDASKHLARALGLPLGEHWAAAIWLAAMLAHTQPAASSVQAELEAELERHPEAHDLRGANGRYIKAARARLGRLRPRLRVDLPLPEAPEPLDLLLAGAQAYRAGRPSEAIAHSEAATGLTSVPRVEAPAHLVAAAAHLLLGHTGLAVDSFRLGNAIIGRERLFSAYGFIPPEAASALAELAGERVHGTDNAPSDPRLPKLTKREREVLGLLATGLPMGRIAAQLYISPNTLKATVRAVYRKLGVTSRQQAVDAARRLPN